MSIRNTSITFSGINLQVEYEYTPYHKGSTDSMGVPLEPDDAEEVECINSITTTENVAELLSEKDINWLKEAILEAINEEPVEEN